MKLKSFYCIVLVTVLLTSCGSVKNVAYLQNSDAVDLSESRVLYDAHIMPKDQITISVNTTTPEVSLPFNLLLQNAYQQARSISTSGGTLMPYLVDNDGYINFPILGSLKVAGLTKSECERMILEKIRPYMAATENPVVTVTMFSYSISVLGEVSRPGSYQVGREKISILEALAQAGDLTIYGVRDRVKLIREDATGQKEIHVLNLNDANIINSPYYYLQQNDVVYVEPRKIETRNAFISANTSIWISLASALMSVATFIIALSK
jgi:polysaccharide export outer membrane protein